MNNLLLYLIQTTAVFSVLYLLYILFLDRLTFHKLNRLVLLLLLPVSSIIPFSNHLFPSISSKIVEVPLFQHIPLTIDEQYQVIQQPLANSLFNFSSVVITIYLIVAFIFLIRIFINTRQLVVLKNNSVIHKKNGYRLVIANVPQIFSYFKWIFIPKHTFENLDPQILEHETIHINSKHSLDVILTEIYIAFFWFNPLVYFYRKSLKSIHEYQADQGVLQNGIKTSQYMQLLLQSLEIQKPNNLYNYFNQPILKKRVSMMTKPTSKLKAKFTYLLFLPVCAFLVSAFTKPTFNNNPVIKTFKLAEFEGTPPALFPVKNATKKDITAFFGEQGQHSKTNVDIIHTGIDIKAKLGTPVLASADGIISKASMEGDWGNLVVITHTNGYETWYAHLSGFKAKENQEVKKGDLIGYVGNTGRSSGPHLHYEVKHNGQHVNPLDYIE